ncbi:glycosyltransferase [Larkinella soli]|uniref:glycosyltransferase n=1 Tax=Larkinella soli TaxID=1770527 RepID=UPI000FFBFC7B|nr:nucleotide disphospho-sugar-binding domain-containing protein [Larkinella soli]
MKTTPKYKILMATVPADGHFNPLTGLAMYLKQQGHDVRWYTGARYKRRVADLGLPFYPFQAAREIHQNNLNELLPERLKIQGALARIKFDIRHLFLSNVPGNLTDVKQLQGTFDFDVLLCDSGFLAFHLIQEVLHKPAIVLGIAPLTETSRDLPPATLGLTPGHGPLIRMRDALLRLIFPRLIFADSRAYYNELIRPYGLPSMTDTILDMLPRYPALYLQSGVPGFEYVRRDLSPKVRFVGPLLPYRKTATPAFPYAEQARRYQKVVLISQGTVDNKDPQKLIIPSLEAFKDEPYLLLVATGGQHTEALQARYRQANIIIADFIDYAATLPHTDLFVSCGGYGSVLLSLNYGVPILAAGKHEGKNEIVARIGYFKLGVNLGTETPSPRQIRQGAHEIWRNPVYRENGARLRQEFARYDPNQLCEYYIQEIVSRFPVRQTLSRAV